MDKKQLVERIDALGLNIDHRLPLSRLRAEVARAEREIAEENTDEEKTEAKAQTSTQAEAKVPKAVAPTEPEPKSEPQRYRVLASGAVTDWRYTVDGRMYTLPAGSVVSANTHDIKGINGQGIPLAKLAKLEP